MNILETIGKKTLNISKLFIETGNFIIFHISILPRYIKVFKRWRETIKQIEIIGSDTIFIIVITATFTGMVIAIQFYHGYHKFQAESLIGYSIFVLVCREFGPIFAALMIISRCMSAMCAELSVMRVTQQIDALELLAIDSKEYLLIPRIIGTIIAAPFLVFIFDMVANLSAFLTSYYILDLNPVQYQKIVQQYANMDDILSSMIKGLVFGYTIALITTYIGYNSKGGAKGVGEATTKTVVSCSIAIFALNYLISDLILVFG